jgi:hypothetical protein
MYSCSTPTAPGGKDVVVFGNVETTGGIVAKSVGPIGTTVVAVPVTSTPHETRTNIAVATVANTDLKSRFTITPIVNDLKQVAGEQ